MWGHGRVCLRISHELNKLNIHVSVVCERKVNDPFIPIFPSMNLVRIEKSSRWWSYIYNSHEE